MSIFLRVTRSCCNFVTDLFRKIHIVKTLLLLHCTIVLLSGCTPVAITPDKDAITVSAGQKVIIQMTTDWKSQTRWVVKNYSDILQYNKAIIEENKDPHQATDNIESFTFTCLKPGTAIVTFRLQKIWGIDKPEEKIKTIYIR